MMKLAEALLRRADLHRKIKELTARIVKVATVQEGETPQEDPKTLQRALSKNLAEFKELIVRINEANNRTILDDGRTLMNTLAQRDVLNMEAVALSQIREAATIKNDRYSTTEIRTIPTMEVSKLQQEMDEVYKTIRELNVNIQAINWSVEL